ncbi:hypothetical protein ACJ41O_005413 [Fusarium nematophilum]
MVKANAAAAPVASGPGVYSAVYSGIPVYEFQLLVSTSRLEQESSSEMYKRTFTRRFKVDMENTKAPGSLSKAVKHWQSDTASSIDCGPYSNSSLVQRALPLLPGTPANPRDQNRNLRCRNGTVSPPPPVVHDDGDTLMGDEDTPDNLTVASASYMAEDERFDMTNLPGTSKKRRREDVLQDLTEQQHALYGDELLDYFLLSKTEQPAVKPEPPPNFQPNWPIDAEDHTALHWASAMGDVDVVKQLKRFNASPTVKNIRGETPFMHSVNFTNCYEKQTFPVVMKELFETFDARDNMGCTVIHHAAVMKNGRVFNSSCSRYYLDNILNKLQETLEPSAFQQLLDIQDNEGNTALHLAAQRNARKCIRALLGRNASSDLTNNEGVRAEDLIMDLNATKKDRGPQRSSSPFAPDSQRHASFRDALVEKSNRKPPTVFQSAAANTVQSRISPLIMEKFQDLAKSYEDEWREKDGAESEARRILTNTQAELNLVRQQIAEVEAQLEPDDAASKIMNEANLAKHQVLSLITHQNRLHVQRSVDGELSRINGEAGGGGGGLQEESYEERLSLARQLSQMLAEQRQAETDYVEALSMVGTGDKIEKYRKLLRRCLDPKDGESLDTNLDSLIEMMEEEREVHGMDAAMDPEPMELTVGI